MIGNTRLCFVQVFGLVFAAALRSHSVVNAAMKRLACLVEWLCSGRSTSDGTAGESIVGVAPEQLQKESMQYAPSLETPEQVSKLQDPKASEQSMPAPSVVVPWVLRDLAASIDLYKLQYDDQGVYMKEALYEAHAERLLRCWSEHEQEFPGSLSQELLTFLRTNLKLTSAERVSYESHVTNAVCKVAAFLVAFFCEEPLSSAEHKQGLNGKSLWPPVVAALGKQATVCTTESADLDAGWQENFFFKEIVSETYSLRASQRDLPSLRQLRHAVQQLIDDRTKAKEQALRDAAKASINHAPWEVVTTKS